MGAGDSIRICYIQEYKTNVFKRIFGVITLKKFNDNLILNFPKYNKITKKIYQNKVNKKIVEILYKSNIDTIVLPKSLKQEDIKNKLYEQNLNILNGNVLFEILILDCLKLISKIQSKELKKTEITILANDISVYLIENILVLMDEVKSINIVTNNVNKFKKIEEKIRNKYGILIRISNNKRKSLANSKIIINIDFPEETINSYNIYNNAIILNINNKIKIHAKKFNGIIIQNYKIKTESEDLKKIKEELNDFEYTELYESLIIKEKNLYDTRQVLQENNTKILKFIGNNGEINNKEFVNLL